jgi:hypothetical protein
VAPIGTVHNFALRKAKKGIDTPSLQGVNKPDNLTELEVFIEEIAPISTGIEAKIKEVNDLLDEWKDSVEPSLFNSDDYVNELRNIISQGISILEQMDGTEYSTTIRLTPEERELLADVLEYLPLSFEHYSVDEDKYEVVENVYERLTGSRLG